MELAQERITAGLLAAMKAEAEGHHFYRMAAHSTIDLQGQRVFDQLAQEELQHLNFLRAQYQAVLAQGHPDAAITLGQPQSFAGASPIFSPSLRARIADAHFEMTALSVGIQLELTAERYYEEQAKTAEDDTVQRFYRELAAWEAGHYQTLLVQQDALKDDYWTASGFAPF